MKVLIIQTAFLGDAIISLSLAEELRRLSPDVEISYLVRPEVAPIIKLSQSVNKIYTFDKYNTESGLSGIQKKASELNTEGFDIVLTLHNSKRTIMLIKRLNIERKIGYGNDESLTDKVKEQQEPHSARAIRLLQVIFPEADLKALPKLIPKSNSLSTKITKLRRPIITIAPDSVWKTKQWGISNFSNLVDSLLAKNCSVILTGSIKENTLINDYKSLGNNLLNLIAKTSLEELVSIISYSDLLISNDSAPVHIATATGTPSIVLFGPTVPEFGFAPPPELGQIIQNEELWCRPCASHGSNECPIHTHECMTSMSPNLVFQKAVEAIGV
jgi:heptosyltransferase II